MGSVWISIVTNVGPEPFDQARGELTGLARLSVNPEVACEFGRQDLTG
jgi:hypothetical protein